MSAHLSMNRVCILASLILIGTFGTAQNDARLRAPSVSWIMLDTSAVKERMLLLNTTDSGIVAVRPFPGRTISVEAARTHGSFIPSHRIEALTFRKKGNKAMTITLCATGMSLLAGMLAAQLPPPTHTEYFDGAAQAAMILDLAFLGGVGGAGLGFAITYKPKEFKIQRSLEHFRQLRPQIDAYKAH